MFFLSLQNQSKNTESDVDSEKEITLSYPSIFKDFMGTVQYKLMEYKFKILNSFCKAQYMLIQSTSHGVQWDLFPSMNAQDCTCIAGER